MQPVEHLCYMLSTKPSNHCMKRYLPILFLSLLFAHFHLFADRQVLEIPRADGSTIIGYLDRPVPQADLPIVVFIDGSDQVSAQASHEKLAARFNARNIGFISLEKRGITSRKIDTQEFFAHDCFEERFQDYSLLLKQLESRTISGCNGHIILLGGSEGGKIAPRLSLVFPSLISGLVIIGSGGGLSFGEDMKYQSQQLIQQMNALKRLTYQARSVIFPNEIDELYDDMLAQPDSLEMCGPKTWKWFASYLRYDLLADFLKVEAPIYMIHGKEDIMVPIKSADLVKEAFDRAGKTNLHYARYDDLGHALTGREDVYGPMMKWVSDQVYPRSL